MQLSNAGLELLKRSEGLRSQTYLDVAGIPTIGFGHRVQPGEHFASEITTAQAEAVLAHDVQAAEQAVSRLVKVPLTQGQFDALVDFVFNLGAARLAGSTLLRYLNEGKYGDAAWQLLAWDHAGSLEIAALKRRREAELRLWSPSQNPSEAAA
jgi:lysozyme